MRAPGAPDDRGLPRVAVGLGLRPGTPAARIVSALGDLRRDFRIHCLATVDRRRTEPGLRRAAEIVGVPIEFFGSADLSEVRVPHPSARTEAAIDTPSVAEAAAILAALGPLIVEKSVVDGVVIAAALFTRPPVRTS